MKIEQIELRYLKVPLRAPFEASFDRLTHREAIFVRVHSEGFNGYAESVAMPRPYYNEETPETVWLMLEQLIIPQLLGREIQSPEEVSQILSPVRRNYMAVSSIEGAIWDVFCKKENRSLSSALGGTRKEISVGVSIGIESSIGEVLNNVGRFIDAGYQKIKVKIKPGFDIELIQAIRDTYGPDVPLMADANSAYTLQDIVHLQKLDAFNLMMIEQPLAHDDIVDHATLQKEIRTPICLDESIHTVADARKAIQLGSCRIINIKIGRVGGLTHAKSIHDLCYAQKIPVWCGGMLELGVGRAHNIAIASLPGFTITGDTSPSSRSFEKDIITPSLDFIRPGFLKVPEEAGIGFEIREDVVHQYTTRQKQFQL